MTKKGFTLIEIMIVLLVFSVGVLAVLRLILHNMSTMNDLEAKTTATFLAKEWLELAYNTRDSNRLASLPRDCIIDNNYNEALDSDPCKNHFLDNQWLRALETTENNIQRKTISDTNLFEEWKLFLKNIWWLKYTHEITDQPSVFTRYISFTGVKDNEKIINTGYILKIESHVLYQKWARTGEILLEWFIWNY